MQSSTDVLLLHDDELKDVAELLSEFEVTWDEENSAQGASDVTGLVIGTPLRLLKWKAAGDPRAVARIALCDGGGRTMERKLRDEGVDFVLRRPINPTALRLLVQHMIYKGPERRRLRRVEAALPLRFRSGWTSQSGLLLEFSVGGCSFLTDQPPTVGQAIKVFLPAEIGQGRELAIKGSVVRSHAAPEGKDEEHVVGVRFDEPSPGKRQKLAAAVVARPQQLPHIEASPPPSKDGVAARGSVPTDSPVPAGESSGAAELAVAGGPSSQGVERRQTPRASYEAKVHGAIGSDPVVLMGSDISPQGMQVKPEARLGVGVRVKLDLYSRGDVPPIRLDACVARDDGERGLYLEFTNLWPGAPALIERLIKVLPIIHPGTEDGMVITEVVENR